MKRNKVLLGLYVGLLTLAGGTVSAQTGGFYEIGPANIGGQVSSLAFDRQDTTRTTIYAGATTGGLFVKSEREDLLRTLYGNIGAADSLVDDLVSNLSMWHRVPYKVGNKDVALPINCMVGTPDNMIYIGTGNDDYAVGSNYTKMSVKGMGVYRFDPATSQFTMIPNTNTSNFAAVNSMDYLYRDGVLYLYVATNTGLYRWRHVDGVDDWSAAPTQVFTGNVDQVVINRKTRVAYFVHSGVNELQLHRIGNAAAASASLNTFNISASNSAFSAPNTAIKLGLAEVDSTFLYAMVINNLGRMENLYLTRDEQTWTTLTTASVQPFYFNNGKTCGAVYVDPTNPRRVLIAGSNIMLGEGFVEGSYYQWTTLSASEYELNGGDYMSTVFGSYSFVHSGIHQIMSTYIPIIEDGEDWSYDMYYFATDGGVYSSSNLVGLFNNENLGMNNMQINSLAVAPDGSILTGASNNACPIIEAVLDHNAGNPVTTWYDTDHSQIRVLNHDANVLWNGNGGAVAASAFQQVMPQSRRTIFTSSENGNYGRSYADYLDYTNITTWSIGEGFVTDKLSGGPQMGALSLWETDHNTLFQNYVKMAPDTLGYILRPQSSTSSTYDTVWVNDTTNHDGRGSAFKMKKGDKVIFHSRSHNDYPFEYVYQVNNLTAKDTVTVLNPICSHMMVIGHMPANGMNATEQTSTAVYFSWTPTDFTKVYQSSELSGNPDDELLNKQQWFAPIYRVDRSLDPEFAHAYPRQAVFSNDGRFAYVNVYDADTNNHRSMIVRLSNFEKINDYLSLNGRQIRDSLSLESYKLNPEDAPIQSQEMTYQGSRWFPRAISNIAVDNRDGQDRLVITFEGYDSEHGNVAIVNNASTSFDVTMAPITASSEMPAYCALVEDSTGTIYVGAQDGVYYSSNNGSTWVSHPKLTGVPVTAMCQQTMKLPTRYNLTHTGISANNFVFAKTKWPRALYFGTYGRGVFMDMTYVTDFENEVCDPDDYIVDIPTVHSTGVNSVKLYPNPVFGEANVAVTVASAGNAVVRVYDLSGRCVMTQNMGHIAEGEHNFTLVCSGMAKGMYLVNVIIGGNTSAAKMLVR